MRKIGPTNVLLKVGLTIYSSSVQHVGHDLIMTSTVEEFHREDPPNIYKRRSAEIVVKDDARIGPIISLHRSGTSRENTFS